MTQGWHDCPATVIESTTADNIATWEIKASECKLGSFHGADFVGDLHDSRIYIRWYVVKMWWKHKCADLMGMQKSGVSWQHWCGGGFLRHWSMA